MALKKLIAIIISCCFLLDIMGYHIIFYLRQEGIKAEMREAIRMQTKSELETDFVFDLNDKRAMKQLNWEGDDEFSFNGEMYDVIEKKIENAGLNDLGQRKLIIRALADKKETTLINNSKNKWGHDEKSNKAADDLFQLLQSLFHSSTTDEFAVIRPLANKFYFISPLLPLPVKKILTPPPQAC